MARRSNSNRRNSNRRSNPEREARKAKQAELVKAVSEMTEAQRMALVERFGTAVNCEGRPLSLFNACLLISQLETVSMVGGFKQWQAAGRVVRKGERGLAIWIPVSRRRDENASDDDENSPRFILRPVFDISQTEPLEAEKSEAA